MKKEPKGKLKIIKTELDQKSDAAVFVEIYFEDEDKNLFKHRVSSFLFDLKYLE